MIKKLAIIATHPVQYNVPLFQLLHSNCKIQIKVFYTWGLETIKDKFDPGFDMSVSWNLPLLDGYENIFCNNIARNKGSHHFFGIDNPDLIQLVSEFSPNGILIFGWRFKSHLKLMRHFKGSIPILFRGDSTLIDKQNYFKSKFRIFFLKWVYRHIDKAFYVGKCNYDYFVASGLKKNQLIFAPHAVDNKRFGNLSPLSKKISFNQKENLGIESGHFVFLYTGKFQKKKNIIFLIESFIQASFGDDVHLLLVGAGNLESDIKKSIKGCKNIHLLGFVNQQEMPSIYDLADVFILPSIGPGETWGLSVNEAMANGKAVIVSDKCGCARDLVRENGFVFETENYADLTNKMKMIISNKENLIQMKQNSKNIIQDYSLDKLASVIENTVISL